MLQTRHISRILLVLVIIALPVLANGEVSLSYFKSMPYDRASGLHSSSEDTSVPACQQTVHVPGAIWLRLQFGGYNLGEKSHITMTSEEDGGIQRHDARSLPNYRNRSAFFNGDTVTVELFVAPGEENIYFTIETVFYQEASGGTGEELPAIETPGLDSPLDEEGDRPVEDICGADDRVAAVDPAVGRFVFFDAVNNTFARCTAWIVSNGCHLTAAHCFNRADFGDPDLMEFNVPASDANGDPNFADPDDQYPVDAGSETLGTAEDLGRDWAVFGCNHNSNTGLLPVQGQNDFFRVSKDSVPGTIRITGHGVDDGVANRTLQTSTGPYVGETGAGSDIYVEYQVDSRDGNSGGPIILDGTETCIGIHTHGGCDPGAGEGNAGTSFENDDLEAAIQDFRGTNFQYVDVGHPISSALEDGTVMRPFDTIPEATSSVSPGGTVSIVAGTYSKTDNTFTLGADGKSMTLEAPVGTVYIGN